MPIRLYSTAFLEQARADLVASRFHAGINTMQTEAMRALNAARDSLATESIPDITGYQLPTFADALGGGQPDDLGGTAAPVDAGLSEDLVPQPEVPPEGYPDSPMPPSAPVAPGATPAPGSTGSGIDHSSRVAFLRSAAPYAVAAERATGIPAEVTMSVALLEGSWQVEPPGHNYFGIKGANPQTGATTGAVGTQEEVGGQMVNTQANFRAYDNPAQSFTDFGQFLRENPRYAGALRILDQTHNGAAFIDAVHQAGYATDSGWASKVKAIAGEISGFVQDARARLAGGGGG